MRLDYTILQNIRFECVQNKTRSKSFFCLGNNLGSIDHYPVQSLFKTLNNLSSSYSKCMSNTSQFVFSSGKIASRICPHGSVKYSPLLFYETAHNLAYRSAYYFSLHAKHHETILYIKPPSSIKKPFENVVPFKF